MNPDFEILEIAGVKLYPIQIVAQMMKVSVQTMSKLIREGELKPRSLGNVKYIEEKQLQEFLRRTDNDPIL